MSPANSPAPDAPRYRALHFGVTQAALCDASGQALTTLPADAPAQTLYLEATQALQPYAVHMAERLAHWAAVAPQRSLFAKRAAGGDWVHVSFGQAYARARQIAQHLLERALSVERPVAILSENDLDHAQLALGCLCAGVPYAPISPAYSLQSQSFEKLQHCLKLLTPGVIFVADLARFGPALQAAAPSDCEIVYATNSGATHTGNTTEKIANKHGGYWTCTQFDSFFSPVECVDVDAAMQRITGETTAKFLFTSGSTKLPKAVINTQRMWCANQQQMRQSMPMLQEPPVLVDWLPWNHTFGGNHNFGMVVYNGGTLYIDDGKPTPALMGETLRNLREIAPTAYFNVPSGFEAIANAMQAADAPGLALRKKLLSKVQMFFYAGAAMGQAVWDRLHAAQEAELGERIVMGTGLGMTESAPFGLFVTSPRVKSGDLGLPTPGMRLKLVLNQGKTEVRYQGPNITPGYWRQPESTQSAFDEEGYFLTGDAVTWIDPQDLHQGLRFDGRIAEDFKLATGTFASVGPLRARLIAAGAPYVQDAVITGHGLSEIGALVLPTAALRAACGVAADAPEAALADSALACRLLADVLQRGNLGATGSASRVARALWLHAPPSIDHGEVTDKGSINQSAVLKHRALVVAALHAASVPGIVFAP